MDLYGRNRVELLFHKREKLIQVEKTPADLKGEFSICAQSDSVLWIGTNGWGLFKIVLDRGSYPVSVKSYKQYRYQFDCNNCLNNNSIFLFCQMEKKAYG